MIVLCLLIAQTFKSLKKVVDFGLTNSRNQVCGTRLGFVSLLGTLYGSMPPIRPEATQTSLCFAMESCIFLIPMNGWRPMTDI